MSLYFRYLTFFNPYFLAGIFTLPNGYVFNFFTCAYQGVSKVRFQENLACFFFLVTSVLRFALLPYYRQKLY